jgi:hypothetical protein
MGLFEFLRSDLDRQLVADREKLCQILAIGEYSEREPALLAFAREVGASTFQSDRSGTPPSQHQLVDNVHVALQTKAMIAAVTTSDRYVAVTLVLAVIALLSTIAAWLPVFAQRL